MPPDDTLPLTTPTISAPRPWLAAWTLAERELVRFLRQGNRVFGALGQPVIFWLLFSEGLKTRDMDYQFFFPGTLVMILLFTAIFATVSIIEDRREGFLQGVLVAPLPRWSMVLGKVLGGTLLAMLQGLIFLVLGLVTLDMSPGVLGVAGTIVLMFVVAFGLTSLGFILSWQMDSTQGFHAVMMLLLMPMWLLSGAFFPSSDGWLGWIVAINPLTYGVAGMRRLLQLSSGETVPVEYGMALCWSVSIVFAAVAFGLSCLVASRRTTGDLL